MDEVPLLTLLVAIAGPLGIALGWWLGHRSERERQAREERKLAYAEFARSIMEFRAAERKDRPAVRHHRYESMAALTLLAPPRVFQAAWAVVTVQDQLLEDLSEQELKVAQDEIWTHVSTFTTLARADLGVRENPFGKLKPVTTWSGPPMLDLNLLKQDAADQQAAPAEGRRPAI